MSVSVSVSQAFCTTQLKAQGPSRTCNESKEERRRSLRHGEGQSYAMMSAAAASTLYIPPLSLSLARALSPTHTLSHTHTRSLPPSQGNSRDDVGGDSSLSLSLSRSRSLSHTLSLTNTLSLFLSLSLCHGYDHHTVLSSGIVSS